ncbi:RHS repeat-associated protein [Chitinophaga niastensis]|uniref:RHS repeat-associated protein n=1 Tax=Chitinophaga niastensis TaxID=536980 RepID=A0A2P8HHN5_CHINA|nr:RHS repeat-associated core domain-containing protein [Chitinophaga niastensis]PSL45742.1 RHS repeat-associated protein [Chitinophaga niastensis]
MAGISSNALKGSNYPENRKKYNGNELQSKEFNDGSGLEWFDFNARTYDQQIGRFLQKDDRVENHYDLTPYHFAMNNPLLFADPSGMDTTRGTTAANNPQQGDVLVVPGQKGQESFYTYNKDGGWTGTGMNGGTLNGVTITGRGDTNGDNNNAARSSGGSVALTGVPMPIGFPGYSPPSGITLPPVVIPAPNPILLVIALILLPANYGERSSDYIPPGYLGKPYTYSKGGPKNVWPDGQYTKPNPNTIDWNKGDQQLADEITGTGVPKGPKTPNNLIKKWFRDKRPN